MRRLEVLLFCVVVTAAPARSQPLPLIDNDRVIVRDITLTSAVVTLGHTGDHITVFLSGGDVRTNGSAEQHTAGTVTIGGAGRESLAALSGMPRLIVVDLKGGPGAHPVNTTGYPPAFPRPGVRKLAQTGRFTVWSYDWSPGKPTPMHFHDKDVVVIYRGEGTLDSVTPDGRHTPTVHHMGEIRFNKGNRTHYELLTQGALGAIMIELQ